MITITEYYVAEALFRITDVLNAAKESAMIENSIVSCLYRNFLA